MTPAEFVVGLQHYYGDKKLESEIAQMYKRKMLRFTTEQILQLYEKVIETSKYYPKIVEIFGLAAEMGFLQRRNRSSPKVHEWQPSSCKLCGGEGRLAVFFSILQLQDEGRWRRKDRLERIFALSDSAASDYQLKNCDHVEFLYRCNCMAGRAATIPEAWPIWIGETHEKHGSD